jgi:hypothetical protein
MSNKNNYKTLSKMYDNPCPNNPFNAKIITSNNNTGSVLNNKQQNTQASCLMPHPQKYFYGQTKTENESGYLWENPNNNTQIMCYDNSNPNIAKPIQCCPNHKNNDYTTILPFDTSDPSPPAGSNKRYYGSSPVDQNNDKPFRCWGEWVNVPDIDISYFYCLFNYIRKVFILKGSRVMLANNSMRILRTRSDGGSTGSSNVEIGHITGSWGPLNKQPVPAPPTKTISINSEKIFSKDKITFTTIDDSLLSSNPQNKYGPDPLNNNMWYIANAPLDKNMKPIGISTTQWSLPDFSKPITPPPDNIESLSKNMSELVNMIQQLASQIIFHNNAVLLTRNSSYCGRILTPYSSPTYNWIAKAQRVNTDHNWDFFINITKTNMNSNNNQLQIDNIMKQIQSILSDSTPINIWILSTIKNILTNGIITNDSVNIKLGPSLSYLKAVKEVPIVQLSSKPTDPFYITKAFSEVNLIDKEWSLTNDTQKQCLNCTVNSKAKNWNCGKGPPNPIPDPLWWNITTNKEINIDNIKC